MDSGFKRSLSLDNMLLYFENDLSTDEFLTGK
jgi:hypothetical protein